MRATRTERSGTPAGSPPAGSPPAGSGPLAGFLVIDKPSGKTSHDVVAIVRRLSGTRRVGHAGTLDPMATGVLVLGLGRATRLLGYISGSDKEYTATVRLGQSSDTDDADGAVSATTDARGLTQSEIRAAADRFIGRIEQVPSTVSAVKIGGVRAHERVRRGETLQLPSRSVTVAHLAVRALRPDAAGTVDVDISVECSTGTYVRALARDLGETLGVGGHLVALRRTRVGPFSEDEAVDLPADIEGPVHDPVPHPLQLLELDDVVPRVFPHARVTADQVRSVLHGVRIAVPTELTAVPAEAAFALLDPQGRALAIATADQGVCRYAAVLPHAAGSPAAEGSRNQSRSRGNSASQPL